MPKSGSLLVMRKKLPDLKLFTTGDLPIDKVCTITGMSALSAAAYVHWPAGVETLLGIGANRAVASLFGGYVVGAAVLGAVDLLRVGSRPAEEVITSCIETLNVLLPFGYLGHGTFLRSLPTAVITQLPGRARQRGYHGLARNIDLLLHK